MTDESPIIVALDFPNAKLTHAFLNRIRGRHCKLKVGLELFIAEGPGFVEQLTRQGHQVFLDLKLHDIPNTVASACKSAANLGAWMMTLHASGGNEMLQAAHAAMSEGDHATKLIAVTVLTSLDQQQLHSIGMQSSAEECVIQLAKVALQAKMDGIVCSVHEAQAVRRRWGLQPMIVTPGIRLRDDNKDDQSRISTPQTANESGANYIVVGRPITQAKDPMYAMDQYLTHWASNDS